MLKKEKENNDKQFNQIKEELKKINERLKKCEDEINQITVKLVAFEKNNGSNNLPKNDMEKNTKKKMKVDRMLNIKEINKKITICVVIYLILIKYLIIFFYQ